MLIFVRAVMYVLLGLVSLLFAGFVYAVLGLFGVALGIVSFLLVHGLSPHMSPRDAEAWGSWFMAGGGLLGGGSGLVLLARVWILQARSSADPVLQRLGNSMHDLSQAIKKPLAQ